LTEGRRYYATLLSLLGNRNISMDTITTPVFLRCMVTNSWKASVSIVAGSSDSWIQEATSASIKMFTVIVMCAAVNLHSE
jgi:hypothetical protein